MCGIEVTMKFGVFDHMDDAGLPLGQLYADRLRLVEAYDRAIEHAPGFALAHAAKAHLLLERGR